MAFSISRIVFANRYKYEINNRQQFSMECHDPCHSSMTFKEIISQNPDHYCNSCSDLSAVFYECKICINPLQNTKIAKCKKCDEFWCGACRRVISVCPYCRTPIPKTYSEKLTEFIDSLELPCRNHRLGCEVFLFSTNRLSHELSCSFRHIICPVSKKCASYVPYNNLKNHIATIHKVKAFETNYVDVQINNFDMLLTQAYKRDSILDICLIVFDTLFYVRILLRDFKMSVYTIQKNLKTEPNVYKEMTKYKAKICFDDYWRKECTINMPIGNTEYTKSTVLLIPDLWVKSPAGNKFKIRTEVIPSPENISK